MDNLHEFCWIFFQTTKQFNESPDKRAMIAKEIVASEASYLRVLEAVKDVYFKPLKNALNSNR